MEKEASTTGPTCGDGSLSVPQVGMCGGARDNQIEIRGGGYGGHGKLTKTSLKEIFVKKCVCVKDRERG